MIIVILITKHQDIVARANLLQKYLKKHNDLRGSETRSATLEAGKLATTSGWAECLSSRTEGAPIIRRYSSSTPSARRQLPWDG